MELSASLFDLEESDNLSEERVKKQALEILKSYDEKVRLFREASTKVESTPIERQQIIKTKD